MNGALKPGSSAPLISIITVCRNAQRTMATAMKSVLDQTYPGFEYLIVDGNSTDGTMEIVRTMAGRSNGRVRWVSEPDEGIYDAMNKGLRLAAGDIIGILNSDDQYEPDTLQSVVDTYRNNGPGVFYGILRIMDGSRLEGLRAVAPAFLHRESLGHPAYFVSRSLYEQHGVYDRQYRFAADYELMLRLYHRGVSFHVIERVVATYHQGGASTVHGLDTLLEMLAIRRRYGYLTPMQYRLRTMKYRVVDTARRLRLRP